MIRGTSKNMERIANVKKRFVIWGLILALILVVLAAAFSIHCHKVNLYNAVVRTLASGETDEYGVSVDIHPRGQSTDSWDKMDDVLGVTTRGIIYEVTVVNGTEDDMNVWSLTMGFGEDCFVNNAWCGTVEVHQSADGAKLVQTVDLRNCDRDALTLRYHVAGNDVMIALNSDSTLVYIPSTTDDEMPLEAGRTVNAGLIFYGYSDSVDIRDFKLEYQLHKGYLQDSSARFYVVGFIVWGVLLLVFCAVALITSHYEKRLQESDRLIRESLDVFTNFVDAKDPYTKGHSRRVAEYSRRIAEKLGFSEERCRQVFYIALLHDIGKCYVPDEILKKPARLTDEEFAIIKTHTTKGAEMVKSFSSIPDIREGALYHHERYDGRGYPTGLCGEEIPLIGRIICVADSYDAMNSSRVYRKKLSREVIIQELEKNSGTQFDPKIASVFLEILRSLPEEE